MSSNWLRDHVRSVRSQNGEDGVLDAIFQRIGLSEHPQCVEFGAWDGEHLSNTWHQIHDRGFFGVLIEADPVKYTALVRRTAEIGNIHPIHAMVRSEGPSSLDAILATTPLRSDFDLLSIDIDNDDYHVWRPFHQYRPRVVVIEVNTQFGPHRQVIAKPGARTFTHRSGSSLRTMTHLAGKKGYRLAFHTGNAIYVRAEEADAIGIDPNEPLAQLFTHGPSLRFPDRARAMAGDLWHRRVGLAGLMG